MNKRSLTSSELREVLRPHIVRALEGQGADAGRVARALVGEALFILQLAGAGRDDSIAQLLRATLKFFSTSVIGPFGKTPEVKA